MNRRNVLAAGVAGISAAALAQAEAAEAAEAPATGNPELEKIKKLLQAHDEAMTKHDLEGVLATFDDEAAVMGTGPGEMWQGKDELKVAYEHFFMVFDKAAQDFNYKFRVGGLSAEMGWLMTSGDVVMGDPAKEFAQLYRLVDTRNVRPLRVTIPVRPGFLKALRLAASLQLPVRLLPGQPSAGVQGELEEAVAFYLRDPMVEAPVEYFHSAFVSMQSEEPGSLWSALEEDPAVYLRLDETGMPEVESRQPGVDPADYVSDHIASVADTETGECRNCRWLGFCGGYFKQPDPAYSCDGVVRIFEILHQASDEMRADLAGLPRSNSKPKCGDDEYA